jgi:hypothetical protein
MSMTVIYRRRIGSLVLDAFVRESHSRQVEMTKFPIEDGATLTDHIRVDPTELEVDVYVGPAPLIEPPDTPTENGKRASLVWERLNTLMEAREPVDCVSGLKTYQNMILTAISTERTVDTAGGLAFTARLSPLQTVSSQVSTSSVLSTGAARPSTQQAQPQINAGATPATVPQHTSFLEPIKASMGVR